MTTKEKNTENRKRVYKKPMIFMVKLDKDISLVMQSEAPPDPGGSLQPEHFSINPFKL